MDPARTCSFAGNDNDEALNVSHEKANFSASELWLHRWKRCHGIHLVIISGEKYSVDDYAAFREKN